VFQVYPLPARLSRAGTSGCGTCIKYVTIAAFQALRFVTGDGGLPPRIGTVLAMRTGRIRCDVSGCVAVARVWPVSELTGRVNEARGGFFNALLDSSPAQYMSLLPLGKYQITNCFPERFANEQ
jgi:hypothetical protein